MRVAVQRRVLRLATPLKAAHGAVRERELLELTLTDDENLTGRGEAAPLPSYDGVGMDRVQRALQAYRPLL